MVKLMQFEFYKNILSINNYRQIKQLDSDLICLENISISGEKLRVVRLDKDNIVIKGLIQKIDLGEA